MNNRFVSKFEELLAANIVGEVRNLLVTDNNAEFLKSENSIQKQSSARFCTNCGKPLEKGDVFCDECGNKIEQEENSPKDIKALSIDIIVELTKQSITLKN